MVIRSLLTALGFKADNAAALRYDQILNKIFNISKKLVDMTLKFGTAILQSAGEMEQWEIAFETMLQSTEKANKLMQEVIEFAATTPFELPQVVEGTKRLLAFGIGADEVIDKMTQLGNIAAGVGRDKLPQMIRAFGKVRVRGTATMRELNSFIAAGVPILDELAKNLNVSTEEVLGFVRAGEIGFDDVSKAIETMSTGTGQFANLMEKQSKSYLGILTNIKDQFTRIANEAGKQVLPIAKELANEILKFLQVNREFIATKLADFLKEVVKFLAFIFFFMKGLFQVMKKKNVLEFFAKAFQEIVDIVGFFLGIIISIISWLSQFEGVISLIIGALIAWKIAQWGINAAMAANPISLIVIAIFALIAVIWLLVKNWDKIMEALGKIWEGIVEWFIGLWEGVRDKTIEIWEGIISGLKGLWEGFQDFIKGVWDAIVGFAEDAWNKVLEFVDDIERFFADVGELLGIETGGRSSTEGLGRKGITGGTKEAVRGVRGAMTSNEVNLKTEINVTVPPGTAEETAKKIGSETRKVVQEELDKAMKDVIINAPYTRGTGGGF